MTKLTQSTPRPVESRGTNLSTNFATNLSTNLSKVADALVKQTKIVTQDRGEEGDAVLGPRVIRVVEPTLGSANNMS